MEKYGNNHALDFELTDREWGQFQECGCHDFAFTSRGESCGNSTGKRSMHIGGKSLLVIDMDGDGDKDLLEGHELCNELYFFQNAGTSGNARMTYWSEYFPDTVHRANFPVFPAGYFDDFDHDGIKDLMVSPNDITNLFKNIDYRHSAWFYKNSGKDDLPVFHLATKSFLQENMIDVGENAVPALNDLDHDGDLDLLVAGNGFNSEGTFYGYIRLYDNTGSATHPEFTLADEDYLGLSSLKLSNMFIAFADFNSDGAPDLFLSGADPSGTSVVSRILYNQAVKGGISRYDLNDSELIDLPIFANDAPCFTDVDGDGLVDMLLGKNTGRLDYYRNMGEDSAPLFILKQTEYLGIIDSYVEFRRNLVPFSCDLDLDGKPDLLTSDYLGDVFVYWDYRTNPRKSKILYFNSLLGIDQEYKMGYHTWITSGMLYKGKFPVAIFGNNQGGLYLFRQELPGISDEDDRLGIKVFPNPLNNEPVINIRSNQNGRAMIFSSLGQPVTTSIPLTANRTRQMDISYLPRGLFILKVTDYQGRSVSSRIIKVN
jgi:hypothetical protein